MNFWFFDDIIHGKSQRNKFMSHMAYVVLVALLGMLGVRYRTVDPTFIYVGGFVVGMTATILREVYDELSGGNWQAQDILAGMVGTLFALICAAIL